MTSAPPTLPSSSAMRPSMNDCFSRAAWYSAFSERSPCARASAIAFVMACRSTRLRRSSSSRRRSYPGRVIGVRWIDMAPYVNTGPPGRAARRPVLFLVIDPRTLERAPALLAGLGLLPLAFDRRFFVVHAPLHLLIETALDHHLLERLQRGFDLIVRDLDLRSSQARHGSPQPRRRAGKWVSIFEFARAPLIQDSHARLCFCTRTSFWILSRSAARPPMSGGTRSRTFTT